MNNKPDLLFETTTKQENNPMSTSNNASIKSAMKPAGHDSSVEKNESKDDKQDGDIVFGFGVRHNVCAPRKKSAKSVVKKDATPSPSGAEQNLSAEYEDHIDTFSTTMCYLVEYIREASKKAYESLQTNHAEMYRMFIEMVFDARHSKKKSTDEMVLRFSKERSAEPFDVVVPVVDRDHLRAALQYYHAANAARRILAESMIQQIVNAWEHLLGSLIGTRIDSDFLKNSQNIRVSFSDLGKLKDVCEIKKVFINKIVREFLRKNIDEQVAALNEDYKIDVSSSVEKNFLTDLKETIVRRHAIVHCNSIATSEYCDDIKKLGRTPPDVGEELVFSTQDLLHAWDVFFAAGMIVSNMFYVSHARLMKSKELEDEANSIFVTESHAALSQDRNEAASIMLEYANKRKIYGEWPQLATKINLALSYKRRGLLKECFNVLGEHNWDFSNDQFKAAVSALRGNTKEALRIICKICRKDPDFVKAAHDWVVFEDVRRDDEFEKAMQRLVSRRGKTMVKVAAPAVHFSKQADAKAMLKKLFDVASKFKRNQLP